MKRWLTAILLLLLLTVSMNAVADNLFPAKANNGLWGYINENAEWIIMPKWVSAMNFRGAYAVVSDRIESTEDWFTEGVIDQQGTLLIECSYSFDEGFDGWCYGGIDTGIWVVRTSNSATNKWGYFDIPSGYFSGLLYDAEVRCLGDGPMPVILDDQLWYVHRSTGEPIIGPVVLNSYTPDPPNFFNGYAAIAAEDNTCAFLALDGSMVNADNAYEIDSYYSYFGLCPAQSKTSELWGYLSMSTGEIAINACYEMAYEFSYEGYACVKLENGTYGHIDVNGNLIASGFLSKYSFSRGYAYIEEQNILINTAGVTIFTVPQGYRLCSFNLYNDQPDDIFYVAENGLIALESIENNHKGGFVNLDGIWVILPQYGFGNEDYIVGNYTIFSNGVQAMWKLTNEKIKYAYFDESGHQLTDFIYDTAGAFYQGDLAQVWRDGLMGYINLQGEEVYMWQEDD